MNSALTLASASILAVAQALAPLAVLIAILAVTAGATRSQLTAVAQRFSPVKLLLWLGVACHELGHALAALATFTPVHRIEIHWDHGKVLHRTTGSLQQSLIAAGPIVSSTLVAVACGWLVLGPSFVRLSAPFASPLHAGLDAWLAAALTSVTAAAQWLAHGSWPLHLAVLIAMGGVLSTAVPSAHDLQVSTPSMLRVVLVVLVAEAVARAAFHASLVAFARPALTEASSALGLAVFCSLLSLALVAGIAWGLSRLPSRAGGKRR